jgi:hypothetical protein
MPDETKSQTTAAPRMMIARAEIHVTKKDAKGKPVTITGKDDEPRNVTAVVPGTPGLIDAAALFTEAEIASLVAQGVLLDPQVVAEAALTAEG